MRGIFGMMNIRAAQLSDLESLTEIDATMENSRYLHVDRTGSGFTSAWRLEERPLRSKLIERNPFDDERRFVVKQLLTGGEEGLATVVEHEDQPVALMAAVVDFATKTLRVADLRVDFDYRRQGLGLAMLFQCIQSARERELRAVSARTLTSNLAAAHLLAKAGFELGGVDTHVNTNHDLVKEAVTLFWYAALD
jgi:RimJ/RimL family protein N-acetyltransferase